MTVPQFIEHIEEAYTAERPFVTYRKGGETQLKAMVQHDATLYELNSYTVSGFVFAPFDAGPSVVFPVAQSTSYTCEWDPNLGTIVADLPIAYPSSNSVAREKHMALVSKGIQQIEASDSLQKIVVSRKETVPISKKKPLDIFIALVQRYPNAFVYCWYHPKVGMWLGATPETLVAIQGNTFKTMALAGTQPFVSTTDVIWGNKEVAEHAMVQIFIEQALSEFTTDFTSSEVYTHKAGSLLHLRTDIQGMMHTHHQEIEKVIHALHPTPAVCGLPKAAAKTFIVAHEGYDRAYYTGFLGELNMVDASENSSHLFVNLRCMQLEGSTAVVYVGGGITKDSDPAKEWEETVRKTATMKSVLQ